jgi:hypothetical protein
VAANTLETDATVLDVPLDVPRAGVAAPGVVLPDVLVIGAMKCGTSAVHAYLDAHPDIAMSRPKELNFFNGPDVAPHDDADRWWLTGQWHRGLQWYGAQLDADAAVRGESSPAYTSPTSPEAPARMAALVPRVRLVYLVRDPFQRAVSQFAHHARDGAERRTPAEALLDPGSEYVARSRYVERLEPYLRLFDREQLHVVVTERLAARRGPEVAALYRHVGVDPSWSDGRLQRRVHEGGHRVEVPRRVREEFADRVADDTARLRELLGDDLAEWAG